MEARTDQSATGAFADLAQAQAGPLLARTGERWDRMRPDEVDATLGSEVGQGTERVVGSYR